MAEASIDFPTGKADDVTFARSMVPAILPEVSRALPRTLTCTRSTIHTALGDYAIGGENGDAYPRMALRADGKAGPAIYLATSPAAPGKFALVVHPQNGLTIAKRFYNGIPTDARLADDIRAALADDDGVMAFDAEQQGVRYFFAPPGDIPPPVESGALADGTQFEAGPQILISAAGDPHLLDPGSYRHKPSGFACPSTFDGLAVLLMSIEPNAGSLVCSYRAGTDLRYREDDPIRYQVTLFKSPSGETARSVFEQLTAAARNQLRITGDHRPPLAAGRAPAPQFVGYWDTADAGVQGVWVGQAGGWIIFLRAQYAPSAANDAEAGKIAQILFTQAGKQIR